MLEHIALRTKMLASFSAVVILTIAISTISYISVNGLKGHIDNIGGTYLPSIQALLIISEAQTAVDGAENALLYSKHSDQDRQEMYKKFDEIEARYQAAWKVYEPLEQTKDEEKVWKDFVPAWKKWWADHAEFVTKAKAYQQTKNADDYEKMTQQGLVANAKSFGEAEKLLNQIVEINKTNANEAAKSATSAASFSRALIIIIAIVSSIIASILALSLTNAITSALTKISNALGLASKQVRDAASQMSSASQQLASSSAEQASSIEETTASVEEMAGMVANNVEAAARASELSQKVSSLTEQGNETMKSLQGSMKEILVSNEQIEQLVKVIAAIGEKTKVMDEIVFQTKLLSFNASVEAERAGEHGRGFAVVAQEVGNLAQMSGKAAQEISHILSESIVKAETITTENKRKVEGGGHLVSETASALKEIQESAGSVTSGANQVLSASKEQASGIKQVNVAMTTLEKATQENSALAEEVASTSEEMASQCQGLDGIVAELTRLVHGKDQVDGSSTMSANVEQHHYAAHGNGHGTNHAAKAKKPVSMIRKHVVEETHTAPAGTDGWEKL
jgi:methyl-accepting chemotaxis protein